jgi:hypothetical protein
VLVAADGTRSASRIRTVIKAIYARDIEVNEIKSITQQHNIPTLRKAEVRFEYEGGGFFQITDGICGNVLTLDEYAVAYSKEKCPDEWTLFLTARRYWMLVRRYWGDDAAIALSTRLCLAHRIYVLPNFTANQKFTTIFEA